MIIITSSCQKTGDVKVDIDWASFLGNHDLTWDTLKYIPKPDYWAQQNLHHHPGWEEGAFLGNGMIGTMIYKDSPEALRFQLGRYDVNSHRQVDKIDWTVPRLLIGDFLLKPGGKIKSENMSLVLWDAEARGRIETDKGSIQWRSITHAKDMTIMVELIATGDEIGTRLEFRPESGISPRWWYSPDSASVQVEMPPAPVYKETAEGSVSLQSFVGDGEFAVAWKTQEIAPGHMVYYISVANSYPDKTAENTALKYIRTSESKSLEGYIEEHRNFWHNYYPRSFVSLPDKKWEGFYWIQMYKLASATRSDRALIDNQGPWLPLSPWPGVWWNLNVQLSYSPLYTSNRLDLAESLVNQLHEKTLALMSNLPDSLQAGECAHLGRCSDITFNTGCKFLELGNLTWALQTTWRHYRHSMDQQILEEKIYPMLRANINTYLHMMYEDEDGKIHLPPTHSPEYGQSLRTRDANYALALFKWGCQTLIEANHILEIEDPLLPQWKYVLENLSDWPRDENGLMVGRDLSFTMSHRHYSHLFPFYPLHLLDQEDSEQRALIEKSLNHWIGFKGALAGYTYTGASSMAATLGQGEKALEYLEGFFPFMKPNTMYVEAGPVIETPLSCAESIHNILLQSWDDHIRVFPAVSSKWQDLSYHKLLAEGGFEISALRQKGKTKFVKVKSLAGEPLRINPGIAGELQQQGSRIYTLKQENPGIYSIDLKLGEEIVLYESGSDMDFRITPVEGDTQFNHIFGSRSKTLSSGKQLFNPL
ncbi:MAG: alpha-L-fucosidase [Bacteroides sp.]|nr:alpha-L-fucosidase [Bacteroides sp.]